MTQEDNDIVSEVMAGRTDSFASLVHRYQGSLLRLCSVKLGDRAQAEEAAQDIFLKVYRSLAQFDRQASFKTWLFRIALNYCYDLIRKRKRSFWSFKRVDLAVLDQDQKACERGSENSEAERVATLFRELPGEYREILALRELEGMSYEAIAEVLKCSLDAVKSRLKRARKDIVLRLAKREKLKGGKNAA